MAESNEKADQDSMDSDSSEESNGGRSHVVPAKKGERNEMKQKFKVGSKVWVRQDVGTAGSVLLTVVYVEDKDPITKSMSYRLKDSAGNAYKDGSLIAERNLQSAGSGSK